MREFKFRAWDNENEYMITTKQGVYTALSNVMNITIQDNSYYNTGDLLKPNPKKHLMMQYTGIKDKNGIEIYEGDIVEITKSCIWAKGIVIFKDGCFFIKTKTNEEILFPLYLSKINNFKLKVIGNIYDNPEILEEK